MLILMDDGRHHPPTKRNIEDAFKRICEYSQDGDVVFIHYSGTSYHCACRFVGFPFPMTKEPNQKSHLALLFFSFVDQIIVKDMGAE